MAVWPPRDVQLEQKDGGAGLELRNADRFPLMDPDHEFDISQAVVLLIVNDLQLIPSRNYQLIQIGFLRLRLIFIFASLIQFIK